MNAIIKTCWVGAFSSLALSFTGDHILHSDFLNWLGLALMAFFYFSLIAVLCFKGRNNGRKPVGENSR